MKNIPLLIGTIVGTVLLIAGIAVLFSNQDQTADLNPFVDQELVIGEARNVKGADPATAQVTIVEFSDFQCPACRAAQPLVDEILAAYPDQVSLVYRHLTLDSIFPNSRWAAYAAEAAGGFGQFWEMHDLIFERQSIWGVITDRQELKETFATYAEELEIDKQAFLERIEEEAIRQTVAEDVSLAQQLGVNATPTFFVNGERMSAPQLSSAVDSLVTNTNTQEEPE
jgi:protein-disulfide isomerase